MRNKSFLYLVKNVISKHDRMVVEELLWQLDNENYSYPLTAQLACCKLKKMYGTVKQAREAIKE
jgi:hypothetical protein